MKEMLVPFGSVVPPLAMPAYTHCTILHWEGRVKSRSFQEGTVEPLLKDSPY